MLEEKRCHRVLLPVAVALVMVIVAAFGLASTSVAEDLPPEIAKYLNNQQANLMVTDIEKGVTGTAYKYMDVQWDTNSNVPLSPEYEFAEGVAEWVKQKFNSYIKGDNSPTEEFRKLGADKMRTFSDSLLAAIVKNQVILKGSDHTFTVTADNTSISFKLPMGGYLIKLSNGPNCVYQPIATYVRPKSKGDGKTYELEVGDVRGAAAGVAEAKGKKITSTKTVKMNNSDAVTNNDQVSHGQIGDSFIFQVVTPIPHYPDNAVNKTFIVQDQPTSGLTVTTSSIEVKIEDEKLTEKTDYIVEPQSSSNRGKGFKITFDEKQYKAKLADAGKDGKKLTVEYKGTLDNNAPVKGGTKNSAHPLIPKDFYEPGAEFASPSPTPAVTTIYTYGVKITKIGKTGKRSRASAPKLQGAEFKLYREMKNGKQNEVVLKQQATGTAATGKYVVQASSGEGTTTTVTSGPGGLLQIDGLGAGVYTLEEIRAPEGGYALSDKPVKIEIKDDDLNGKPDGSKINGRSVTVDPEDNRLMYDLTNKKANFKLPKTGAIGAVIFGVVGVALIVTSAALVAAHRRRKKKRSS